MKNMEENDYSNSGQPGLKSKVGCPGCGNYIQPEAIICPACGRQVKNIIVQNTGNRAKDKTIALLLAIFLGFWTWVYTYDLDSGKFWINFILSLVSCGLWGFVAWIWAIIDVVSRPDSFYTNFPQG